MEWHAFLSSKITLKQITINYIGIAQTQLRAGSQGCRIQSWKTKITRD